MPDEQLHHRWCCTGTAHESPPLAGLPLVCREYLKEASRCTIQVAGYVAFNDPLVRAAVSGEPFSNVRHCVIGASVWPESIRVSTEIGFPDWFQDHPECLLNNAVI